MTVTEPVQGVALDNPNVWQTRFWVDYDLVPRGDDLVELRLGDRDTRPALLWGELVSSGFDEGRSYLPTPGAFAGLDIVVRVRPQSRTDEVSARLCGLRLAHEVDASCERTPRHSVGLMLGCERIERRWREAGWLEDRTTAELVRAWTDELRAHVVAASSSGVPPASTPRPRHLLGGRGGLVIEDRLAELGADLSALEDEASLLVDAFACTDDTWEAFLRLTGPLTDDERALIARTWPGGDAPHWGPWGPHLEAGF